MNDQNQIPSDIVEIIKAKHLELQAAKLQKEEQERRKQEEAEALGKSKFDAHVESTLAALPEWIRPYYVVGKEPDYLRIAKGWDSVEYIPLNFSIPGLSNIQFQEHGKIWRCDGAFYDPDEDYGPSLGDYNDSGWNVDLEYILVLARKAVVEFEKYQADYAGKEAERAKKREEQAQLERAREAFERDAEARIEQNRKAERAEEQALIDMIKSDPVAMTLVKAFVFIRQERAGFESQIESANESMYSMENYWSGKASELRRQAQDAERRAEEERSRLQSDLDDAEDKIKKAEHKERYGW